MPSRATTRRTRSTSPLCSSGSASRTWPCPASASHRRLRDRPRPPGAAAERLASGPRRHPLLSISFAPLIPDYALWALGAVVALLAVLALVSRGPVALIRAAGLGLVLLAL